VCLLKSHYASSPFGGNNKYKLRDIPLLDLSMEKAKVSRCPLRLLIAHAKAVRINGFLHLKEQGQDAKYPILIGPTANTILSSSSLRLAIAGHCTEHFKCSNTRWMLDSAPSSVLCPKKWTALTARCHCSNFEIDKPMKVIVATNAKTEVAGTSLNPSTAGI
jgi:hypothetical protein